MGRAFAAGLTSPQASHVIYGAIIGLALVLALEPHPPTAAQTAATIAGTALAVALADLYSEVVATRARMRGKLASETRRAIGVKAGAVAGGIAAPSVLFVLAAAGAIELQSAFDVAQWSGIAVIVAYGACSARLAGAGIAWAAAQGLAVGAIGALLIALKALLH